MDLKSGLWTSHIFSPCFFFQSHLSQFPCEKQHKTIEIQRLVAFLTCKPYLQLKIGLASLDQHWWLREPWLGTQELGGGGHFMVVSQCKFQLAGNELHSICGKDLLPSSRWHHNSPPGERPEAVWESVLSSPARLSLDQL